MLAVTDLRARGPASAVRWIGRSTARVAPACPAHAREARSVVAIIAPAHCQARDLHKTFRHFRDAKKLASVNRSIRAKRHVHSLPNCVRVIATSIESMLGISHTLAPVIRANTIQNHTMPEPIATRPLHTASNRNCARSTSMCCKALRSACLNAGVAMSMSNANNDRRIRHAPMCTARVIIISMFQPFIRQRYALRENLKREVAVGQMRIHGHHTPGHLVGSWSELRQ